MLCPSCRAENPEGSRFCLQCGTAQELHCRACEAPLPAGSHYCNQCGAPQQEAAARTEPLAVALSRDEVRARMAGAAGDVEARNRHLDVAREQYGARAPPDTRDG